MHFDWNQIIHALFLFFGSYFGTKHGQSGNSSS